MTDAPQKGTSMTDDIQQQVQGAIDELVESGTERGLQVAVYRRGEQVVDAVAGIADPETGRLVASDTPFYAYSVGKSATATVAHVLVERGLFGYDTPVVELWPEFGAHGKESATVRHVLTHTVGVPGIPANTTPEDLCDWDKMCAAIADAEPWWEPGTKTAYHAYPFGYIVGEIVRRATGKPISQVLKEDVAGPLGVADELYFGMPESELYRLARLEDMEGSEEFLAAMPDDAPFFKLGPRATTPNAEFGNRPDILMADIPAGGKTSARATARMYAALMDEVDGVRLVSPGAAARGLRRGVQRRRPDHGKPDHVGAGLLHRPAWGRPAGGFGRDRDGGRRRKLRVRRHCDRRRIRPDKEQAHRRFLRRRAGRRDRHGSRRRELWAVPYHRARERRI